MKSIMQQIDLKHRIIDVVKINVRNDVEKTILTSLDMSYACKYFKQLIIRTNSNVRFNDLVGLEECFFLSHRQTRLTNSSCLNQDDFNDELDLAEYLFVNGELSFVNCKYL